MSRNRVSLTTSLILLVATLSYSLGVSALSSLGTDFVGTTTNSDFLFYANSSERLRITTTGYVRISTGYLDYLPGGSACANGQILSYNTASTRWQCASDSQGVSGTGANNAMAKWVGNGTGATLSASTNVFESGGFVGIGVTNPLVQLHIDSGIANVSGVRFNRLNSTTPSFTGSNIAAVGVDGSGNLVAIPPGNVAVYTGLARTSPPTPNPDTITQTINYDFNKYFDIPGKATFVVTDGSSAAYNGPYFKENGTSALCSMNGTYGTSPYDCANPDPTTGLSASPYNSFTMTAKGATFGYQLALGARGDAPLFARSGRYNGTQTGGLYTNDSPYQTPAPWQKVITVPANHPEYLFVNTGLNSQLQAISGGGNAGIGTAYPDLRLVIADTTSANRIMRIQRGTQGSDASMITTYGTPYLTLGGLETRTNSLQTIGFGYNSYSGTVRYAPAEIGFLTTSTTGNTQGDIVFANRNGTTNAAPTEVVRITSTGAVGIGITNPTAKLDVAGTFRLGAAGTVTTAAGVCTIASTAITTTATAYTCTGLPASTAVAVTCSAGAAFTTPGTTSLYCRANGTADSVTCNTTVANSVASTYKCMWMQ